jgi:hypothetical protein
LSVFRGNDFVDATCRFKNPAPTPKSEKKRIRFESRVRFEGKDVLGRKEGRNRQFYRRMHHIAVRKMENCRGGKGRKD